MKLKVPLEILTSALVHACTSGISRAAACYDIETQEFDTERGYYRVFDAEWLGAKIGKPLLHDDVPVCARPTPEVFRCPDAEPFATLYRRARLAAPIPFERDDSGRDYFDRRPNAASWDSQFRVCGPRRQFTCALAREVRVQGDFFPYDRARSAEGFVTIGGERLSDFIIRKFQEALDASAE